MENEAVYACDTCQDTGEVDETLGAAWEAHANPHAPCPDCTARVPVSRYVPPKPLPPCTCKMFGRLRLVNFNCSAHSASDSEPK